MRKTLLAAAVSAVFSLPVAGHAQTAPAAAPASPHTFTANIGLYSSYRFRGIDQTYGKPALQGGFDYAHTSGFYLGNWNSNVNSGAGYPSGNLEMDFYGGWKGAWGDWGLDVGAIYYYYPGTDASLANGTALANAKTTSLHTGRVDNTEIYIGGSWKFISLKYFHSVNDYFSVPHTSGSGYIDLSANYDLGGGWGINGHVGHLNFENYSNGRSNGDYTDWKLGVTKDISGWVFGAAYVGTNAKGSCTPNGAGLTQPYCFGNDAPGATGTKNAGRDTLIVSVSRTF